MAGWYSKTTRFLGILTPLCGIDFVRFNDEEGLAGCGEGAG